jgi:hypothetical protein
MLPTALYVVFGSIYQFSVNLYLDYKKCQFLGSIPIIFQNSYPQDQFGVVWTNWRQFMSLIGA